MTTERTAEFPTPSPLPTTIATAADPPQLTAQPTTAPPPTSTSTPEPSPVPSPTPTAEPAAFTFAAVGDYGGSGQGSSDVAALVAGWDPDILLTLGDNNYPDGAAWTIDENISTHYGRFIADGRFFPTLGNHDVTTEFGRPYLDYFDLPGNERYYDFVAGDLHFFAVNSDWREPDGISASSRQAAWLQEALAASTAPWQIVYFHAPPYVSMADKMVPAMRWPFAAWGADLVLNGHAHLYERLTVDGINFVVNGLGGTTIYPFDEIPYPGSQVRFNDDFGALFVRGTAETLDLQFVTRAGIVVDEWHMERGE